MNQNKLAARRTQVAFLLALGVVAMFCQACNIGDILGKLPL